MIHVCDALMGSGKSSSCISYINEHPEKRYVYITPYLDEATRIAKACPEAHFVEPEEKWEYVPDEEDDEIMTTNSIAKRTKTKHTARLLAEGANIATTHQAFLYYTKEMLNNIRTGHYTLIIDEDLQILSMVRGNVDDLRAAERAGYVEEVDGEFTRTDLPYRAGLFLGWFRMMESRNVAFDKDKFLFWVLHANLLQAFDDVFILTYLFEGQSLYNLLKMNGIGYRSIGIRHDAEGYHFQEGAGCVPEYAAHLSEMIHICDHQKMNEIGKDRCSLSANWFRDHPDKVEQLKKNLGNWFTNIQQVDNAKERMWTTFKKCTPKLRGNGYARRFLILNKKATNNFAGSRVLAYAANIFMHPSLKNYYIQHGVDPNEDLYALSTMIQWIWRSAIRNGGEIWIYIPSRRMRNLLTDWIQNVEQEARRIYGEEHEQLSA